MDSSRPALPEAGEDIYERAVSNLNRFIKNLPTTVEEGNTGEDQTLEEATMTETPIEELNEKMRGVEVDKEGNQSDIRKEMVMYIV